MHRITRAITLSAAILAGTGNAYATSTCSLVGNWTDTHSAAIAFATNKRGTATDSALCAAPYKLLVTSRNRSGFDAAGRAPGTKCLPVSATMTWDAGCTEASGMVGAKGKQFHDVWNKVAPNRTWRRPAASALGDGLR